MSNKLKNNKRFILLSFILLMEKKIKKKIVFFFSNNGNRYMALPPRPSFLHILPFWSLIGRITCRKKHGRLILSLFGYWSFINIANVLPTWQCTVPSLSIDLCVYITLHILSFEWNISRCPCTWLTDLMQNAFKKLTITAESHLKLPGIPGLFYKRETLLLLPLNIWSFFRKETNSQKKSH